MCCSPWGRKELDTTEWLNWTELVWGLRLDISSNFPGEGDPAAGGLGTPLERHRLNPSVWWSFSGRRGRGNEAIPLLLCSPCSPPVMAHPSHWTHSLLFCFFSLVAFLLLKCKSWNCCCLQRNLLPLLTSNIQSSLSLPFSLPTHEHSPCLQNCYHCL